jgi:hypothetical protein
MKKLNVRMRHPIDIRDEHILDNCFIINKRTPISIKIIPIVPNEDVKGKVNITSKIPMPIKSDVPIMNNRFVISKMIPININPKAIQANVIMPKSMRKRLFFIFT